MTHSGHEEDSNRDIADLKGLERGGAWGGGDKE